MELAQREPVEQRQGDQKWIDDGIAGDVEDEGIDAGYLQGPARHRGGHEAKRRDERAAAVPFLVTGDQRDRGDHRDREHADIDQIEPGELIGVCHFAEAVLGAALCHPEAQHDHRARQREAGKANLAVTRDPAARGQPGLPDVEADPRKERQAMDVVQRLETARTGRDGEKVGQRKADEDEARHDEGGSRKELRPSALGRRGRSADDARAHATLSCS